MLKRAIALTIAAMTALLSLNAAQGQSYPVRPIRIVTAPAGGGTDFVSRILAKEMGPALGGSVIVDNRPVVTGIENIKNSSADGYSVLVMGLPLWITQFVQDVPWDPISDFAPIAPITTQPLVLVVRPSLPISSVDELIKYAQANPAKLNVGTAGIGTSPDIAAQLFKSSTSANVVIVPYNGSGPAVRALLGDEVQVLFATPSSIVGAISSGDAKPLAVTSSSGSSLFPNLPTVASTVPGFEVVEVLAMFAPAKTSPTIIKILNETVLKALQMPSVKQALTSAQLEVAGGTPSDLSQKVALDISRYGEAIRRSTTK